MKNLFFVFILCLSVSNALADANTVETLQAEIQNLNKQIADIQKTVELQKAEIERLTKLCIENGIECSPKKPLEKPTQEAISQPMFGIFLGETLDSLNKRLKVLATSDLGAKKIEAGETWFVQSDNSNVKLLGVITYHQQVYAIIVQFADSSEQNYKAIKEQLEKKYKNSIEDDGMPAFTIGEKFTRGTLIDGVAIGIQLDYEIGFMKDNKLTLIYLHIPLSKKLEAEVRNQKAGKIKGDL